MKSKPTISSIEHSRVSQIVTFNHISTTKRTSGLVGLTGQGSNMKSRQDQTIKLHYSKRKYCAPKYQHKRNEFLMISRLKNI